MGRNSGLAFSVKGVRRPCAITYGAFTPTALGVGFCAFMSGRECGILGRRVPIVGSAAAGPKAICCCVSGSRLGGRFRGFRCSNSVRGKTGRHFCCSGESCSAVRGTKVCAGRNRRYVCVKRSKRPVSICCLPSKRGDPVVDTGALLRRSSSECGNFCDIAMRSSSKRICDRATLHSLPTVSFITEGSALAEAIDAEPHMRRRARGVG